VSKTGTAGLVLQGRVLAPQGPIDGEVLIDGSGKIACVDTSCASSPGYGSASVLACTNNVISPGLINGHDHSDYATAPPIQHGNTRWQHRNGWRTGAGGEPTVMEPSPADTDPPVAAQELRFLLSGATSVSGTGSVAGLIRNLGDYHWPVRVEGLSGGIVNFDTFPLGDENGVEISSGCAYPAIETQPKAFQDNVYSPHIAEGINAAAENELTCTKATLITNKTAVIHGVGFNANDVNVVQTAGAKIVWSPRSNIDLYGDTAPVTVMKTMGVTIALGTDWLASGSMSMLRELACVDSMNQKYFNNAFSDQEIWQMATKNGAVALGYDSQIGELAEGLLADIAVFSAGAGTDYRAVIAAGDEDVLLVLRGGKVMYGDKAIVSTLATGCSDLPLCGTTKQVCVDTPGQTLATIQAAADASYPLFFCKGTAPMGEPSCVPYRDTYPNGTSATDRDGDGVADAMDKCPDVFDPPRPMDGTSQADVDGDGFGDACDAFPLDPTKH
jgi:Amidohydrolase family